MKPEKDPVFASAVWLKTSLPLIAAGDEAEEARMGFSSLLSNLRKPTEWTDRKSQH